ncbi:MAG: hypothetical protein ACPGC5_02925 [Flavobacteriaceae bacterium]
MTPKRPFRLRMSSRRLLVFLGGWMLATLHLQCSNSDGGGSEGPAPNSSSSPPAAAQLIRPENQSLCLDGEEVTPILSRVSFQWQAAENTQAYTLIVTDVETQQQQQSQITTTEAEVSLTVGKAYRWKVISRQNQSNQTAESPSWIFFLEGNPSPNYAPFPATLVFPASGQSLARVDYPSIPFQWEGADLDNDSLTYDLYVGTNSQTLVLAAENLSEESFTKSNMDVGTYYWQVFSRDPNGNQTASDLQGFVLY